MPAPIISREHLNEAVRLAEKVGHVFISTCDGRGWPHLAAAGRVAITKDGHIVVAEWFCPGTMDNLQMNPRLGIIAWDSAADMGYQMIGELEEMRDIGILDGFTPGAEKNILVPQIERELVIHVDRLMEFKKAPHDDLPE